MLEPRPYQARGIDAALAFFQSARQERPRLLVAPTAAGKSIMIAAIARALGNGVLVLQPSIELLKQNREKYAAIADNSEVYSAGAKSKVIGAVTFATIGSIKGVPELFREFKYLIIDEAHLYPPGSDSMFGGFLKENPQLKILGLTATPFRLRSTMMGSKLVMMHSGNIYSGYCHIIQVQEIAREYWCPLRYQVDTGDMSILKVNSTGAEYTEESLTLYGDRVEEKVMHYVNLCKGLSKLVFVPSVEQAHILSRNTPGSAVVSAKTPKREREHLIDQFKAGFIETIFNVNLLSVGFDYPGLRVVIDAVPTRSLARYYQKIGRLTRQHPSKKIAGVVDLAGNYAQFGRVEDLEIRAVGRTHHVFSGARQLTGVYFGEAYTPNIEAAAEFTDPEISFGKHKGLRLSQVPRGYVEWIVDNITHSGDLVAQAKRLLSQSAPAR